MHTKEMIMKSLQELHNNYDPIIQNYNYRGPMEIYPTFTIKQIAKKIGRTVSTTRKWCKILSKEGLLIKGWKKSYFANSPMTLIFRRSDAKLIKLKYK